MKNYSEKIEKSQNAIEAILAIDNYLFAFFNLENIDLKKIQGKHLEVLDQKVKFILGADKIKFRVSFLVPTNIWNSEIFKEYQKKPTINLVKYI